MEAVGGSLGRFALRAQAGEVRRTWSVAEHKLEVRLALRRAGSQGDALVMRRGSVMRTALLMAALLVAGLLLTPILFGSTPAGPAHRGATGSLTVIVIGANDKPAPGVHIVLQGSDGSHPRAVRTGLTGRYHFTALKPGLYDLRALAKGHTSDWEHNVLVRGGRQTEVTLWLEKKLPTEKPRKSNVGPAGLPAKSKPN